MPMNDERIVFVQLSNFSDTNGALEKHLPRFLRGRRLDVVRIWPIVKKNPLWMSIGLAAGLWHHGLGRLRERGALIEAIIKTPTFFRMASFIARREVAKGGPAAAVFMTQAMFDPARPGTPLILYTDDCILNPVNALFPTAAVLPKNVELERALYDRCDRIAVGGTHVARAMARNYGIGPNKAVVVGMGANVDRDDTVAPDTSLERYSAGRIVFVGIDWVRKGGPELVEAFTRLSARHPGARLTIAGCTPPVDHPAIEVLGRVPHDRVGELMSRASIFAMPSHAEPFGIATVEAARLGLPSIGTTTGGFPDTVRDGETGFLVPPGDVDALEAALDRLLSDPALCRSMGLEAADWARERFAWSSVSQRLAEVIDAAIGSGAREDVTTFGSATPHPA